MATYASTNDWAIDQSYANFAAYTADNPTGYPSATITQFLEKATEFINRVIGTGSNITTTRYVNWLKFLCITMVNRMIQVDQGQAIGNQFSVNDFLQARERMDLQGIGIETKNRTLFYVR